MYKNILLATDLLNEHNHFTQKAVSIAQFCKSKLFFLHVIELPTSIQLAQGLGFTELVSPAKDDAQTVLALIGENFHIPLEQQYVEVGSVKEHIFQKVRELDCQLIILGSQSSHGLHAFLGSTANAVVNHAPCDVLTLRI